MTVFLLQHMYHASSGAEEIKIVGIYTTTEAAFNAYERAKICPGFKRHPKLIASGAEVFSDQTEGFYINPYLLDTDYWEGGFGK